MGAPVLQNIRPSLLTCPSLAVLVLLLLHGLLGCTSINSNQEDPSLVCAAPTAQDNAGRLSIFLNLKQAEVAHLKLKINTVEIFNGELWLPVSLDTKEIDTKKNGVRQVWLGRIELSPGNYEKVKLTFSPEATITSQGKESKLILAELETEVVFPGTFNLQKESSESIFLSWDVEGSLNGRNLGPFAFSLATSRLSAITANQIYVACPDINTIYVVREDKKRVDNSFFVAGRPSYIIVDRAKQRVFVLCQEDGDIKVFDLLTNSLTDIISLPMTFSPIFMTGSADLSKAYVLDDLGHLSVVDLLTGNVLTRKRIGQRPTYVAHLPGTKTVAVSSSMDSRIYLLDEESLEIREQIAVNGSAAGIFKDDEFLYVAEEQSNSIMIFNYIQRTKIKSFFVGYAPRRITGLAGNIYIANSGSGSVSVLRSISNRVAREIPLGNEVYEIVASEKEQVVYVGKKDNEDCGGGLSVLDITSNRVIAEIELGSRPQGIAVAGNGL
jgi:DNA-binding beta-propeller fold protein YncE